MATRAYNLKLLRLLRKVPLRFAFLFEQDINTMTPISNFNKTFVECFGSEVKFQVLFQFLRSSSWDSAGHKDRPLAFLSNDKRSEYLRFTIFFKIWKFADDITIRDYPKV